MASVGIDGRGSGIPRIFLPLGRLYQGVRYDEKERFHFQWLGTERLGDFVNSVGHGVDTQGAFTSAGAEEGPLGCVLGIILDIVFSVLLVFLVAALLWVGVDVVIASVAAVALPLFSSSAARSGSLWPVGAAVAVM